VLHLILLPSRAPQPFLRHECNRPQCCNLKGVLTKRDADIAYQYEAIKYLATRAFSGLFYFCLNPSSHDTGGIIQEDWLTPVAEKMNLLKRVPATKVWLLRPPAPPAPPPMAPCRPPRCPDGFHICSPNAKQSMPFCDRDVDCHGDDDCHRTSDDNCEEETGDCSTAVQGTGPCVVAADASAPSFTCPSVEYTFCGPNERQNEPFCDLDADCYGNTRDCRENTLACPIPNAGCCLHAAIPMGPDERNRIDQLNRLPACAQVMT
jgi:hypothetical protein